MEQGVSIEDLSVDHCETAATDGYRPLPLAVDEPYISYAERVFRKYKDHLSSRLQGKTLDSIPSSSGHL